MRMAVDMSGPDEATWVNLTGNSGHPMSKNYSDQFSAWAAGETFPWNFSRDAVAAAAKDTQMLLPPGERSLGLYERRSRVERADVQQHRGVETERDRRFCGGLLRLIGGGGHGVHHFSVAVFEDRDLDHVEFIEGEFFSGEAVVALEHRCDGLPT